MSYCKYRRKRKQYLKDGVWYDYSPQIYAKGQLVGCGYAECSNSPDTPPITPPDGSKYRRWITMTNDYYCELGDKYYKLKLQVSNDNINWVDANPPEYKRGNLWEAQSADCGADNPEEWRFYANICIKGDLYEQEQLYVYGEPTGELRVGKLVERDSDQCFIWNPVEGEYICEEQIYTPMNCFSWTPSTNGIRMTLNGLNYNIDKEQHNGYCFGDDIQTLKFEPYYNDQEINTINFTSINTENCTDLSKLFKAQTNLTSVDLSLFNTSKVEDMNSMFLDCSSLTSINLFSFNTSSVLNMNSMFKRCKLLKNLNLSSFDVQNTTYMKFMFESCSALTDLNVSNFNMVAGVHNGINNESMFSGCTSLNHITCKQSFKDWCWKYQNSIGLPTAMREGGTGTWTIVG